MSKISIEVSDEQHRAIAALAASQGKSIRDFVLARVLDDEEAGKSGSELTLEAMRDLRTGKDVLRYHNVQEMMADLWQD